MPPAEDWILDSIAQQTQDPIAQIGSADLVIGVLPNREDANGAALAAVRDALKTFSGAVRTVVIQKNGSQGGTSTELQLVDRDSSLMVLSGRIFANPSVAPLQSISDAYQSVFMLGAKLEAKACCVVASDLKTVTSQWISRLAQPILEMDFDLVTPCYDRHKLEGLMNSCIISPLNRALYGRRIENPMGPHLGFSRRVAQRMVGIESEMKAARDRPHPLASLTGTAINAGFQICEAHVGLRLYPSIDWVNVSSLLAQILGPLFLDMERNAAHWQRIRGSQVVPQFGEPALVSKESGIADVHRLIESFQLGTRNLLEVWRLVLPTATLFELGKISRLTPERFRIPDELWVRIVYDFALGHRLRTISRDHLLRAMTPLYLGWVASYAMESESPGALNVEQRLEQLAMAYEAAKPYLVSRWRWPDRFNP